MGWGGGYVQYSTTGDYNIDFILFINYTVIVQFLFVSFSTNMLTHISEDLAGGSDNIVCS